MRYLTAGAVNLFWLILGKALLVQMAIPILTVLLAGTGVLLRLRKLLFQSGVAISGALGPAALLPVHPVGAAVFRRGSTWTGAMAGL